MIFDGPLFTEVVLPFVFVFVVIFAILQKTQLLGKDKAQVDSMVGLVVGLILIGFPQPRDILVGIMPWLAVGVAVILVFFILYGFVVGDLTQSTAIAPWLKNTFLGLAALFTVGVVLFVSGAGKLLLSSFGDSGEIWMNAVMIIIIVAVVAVAIKGGKSATT